MMFVTLKDYSPEVKWGMVSGKLENVKKVKLHTFIAACMDGIAANNCIGQLDYLHSRRYV